MTKQTQKFPNAGDSEIASKTTELIQHEIFGHPVEARLDARSSQWIARAKGFSERSGATLSEALDLMKVQMVFSRPTLPVIHMNGSGGLLERTANDLKGALNVFDEAVSYVDFSPEEQFSFTSLCFALHDYLSAHLAHYKAPGGEEHPDSLTKQLLPGFELSWGRENCRPKKNTREVKDLLNSLRLVEDKFVDWEFNRRDYYPIEGLWEDAFRERRVLRSAIHEMEVGLSASQTA